MPAIRRLLALLLPPLMLLTASGADAALINRTITLDGTFTDWDGTGGTYNPAGNILTNSGQVSTDCQSGTSCEKDGSLSSTGRDLKSFAFTWDNTYLYFYLERWDNSNNVTDWWFYMDTNGNQKMETGEKVLHIKWTGSNRSTVAGLDTYTAANAGGDPMVNSSGSADGYTMPGSVGSEVSLYSNNSGGSTGLQMEARLAWSSLGLTGPTNMGFHISSSNGSNLPGSIIDNMEGPGGNQLFPGDIQVQKTASASSVVSGTNFSYTVTATNLGYNTASSLVIKDVLPPNGTFVSYTANNGSYVDTDANGIPDTWNIPTLVGQATATLTVTVKAANVTANVTDTNTAKLTSWVGLNQSTSNDTASASVTIMPTPLLNTIKTASTASANPGDTIRYRVYVSNAGYGYATSVVAIDKLSQFTAFRLNTFGAGLNVRFTDGSPTSTLALGAVTYSSDNGTTFAYTPTSGGGGAPAGYDANVTNVRIPFTGNMAGLGANFWVEYDVIVR
ncbi:MAG TPA: DUF11 domain-containing protein [Moraxellaceae bacterium]|nr:DUF11 domain-containing protein [Moraxellaceae bacterium]